MWLVPADVHASDARSHHHHVSHHHAGKTERAAALLRRASERPRLADMQADQALLLAELRRCYGSLGHLPTRKDLREANRCEDSSHAVVARPVQVTEHRCDVCLAAV